MMDRTDWGKETPSDLVAIDVETYFDKEMSLRKMSTWEYVFHPKTFPYMMSVKTDTYNWCGDPREFYMWDLFDGKVVCAHNASFDGLVWKRMVRDGVVPKGCKPKRWVCTADLAAYLRVKRNLQSVVKELYGEDISKQERSDAEGKTADDMKADGTWDAMVKYGLHDALWCYRIACDHIKDWPAVDQFISEQNREESWRGFSVDVNAVRGDSGALESLKTKVFRYRKDIPWYPDESELSPIALRKQARAEGIKVPASLAKSDEAAQKFFQEYSSKVPWVAAVRNFRAANTMLKKVESLDRGVREDGTFPYSSVYYGANTGRFTAGTGGNNEDSGGKFNLFNLPRGELQGVDLRGLIVPRKGYKLFVGDYCVAPDTPILMSDLSWAAASTLSIGDKLVGFPEQLVPEGGRSHTYEESTVLKTKTLKKPCVRVTTDKGSVVCSKDHMWVARDGARGRSWTRADELTENHSISWFGSPWSKDDTPDSQWLSGIIDGEASLTSTRVALSSGAVHVNHGSIQIGQKDGPVLNKIYSVLEKLGYPAGKKGHKDKRSGVVKVNIPAQLGRKLIGSLRPVRFMQRAKEMWCGSRTWNSIDGTAHVISVEDLGEQLVCAIETSTKTFVAAGMLSHNCQIEFRLLLWRSGDEETLSMIRDQGYHPYEAMAETVLDVPDAKGLKKKDAKLYSMSKGFSLGCGYQMGGPRFFVQAPILTANDEHPELVYRPTLAEAAAAVALFREKKPKIVNYWHRHQTFLLSSVYNGDPTHSVELASGRWLTYFDPTFALTVDEKTGRERKEIVVRQIRGEPHKRIYGGKLTENEMQATGYDILRDAWAAIADRCLEKDDGSRVVWTLYDELVAEVPEKSAQEDGAELAHLMVSSSPWTKGLPLDVDWKIADRYFK